MNVRDIGGFEVAIAIQGARDDCQDAAAAVATRDGVLLVVADGAGGMSGGKRAAELVIERCRAMAAKNVREGLDDWLLELDGELLRDPRAGLTTAVVVRVSASGVVGASVGDSEAWRVASAVTAGDVAGSGAGRVQRMTFHQRRKPLLGSGEAVPVWFSSDPLGGDALLLGSDGLFKYASPGALLGALAGRSLAEAAPRLLEAVRMADGGWMDDVSAVLCRKGESRR